MVGWWYGWDEAWMCGRACGKGRPATGCVRMVWNHVAAPNVTHALPLGPLAVEVEMGRIMDNGVRVNPLLKAMHCKQ